MAAYILAVVAVCLIVGLAGILAAVKERKERANRAKIWTLEAEGVFRDVGKAEYNTVVFFQNGQMVVLSGLYDISFPEGTRVKISVNGNREYRIEKTES